MDQVQHDNLHDDLRGMIRGELLFDEVSRRLYATDASLFEVEPIGVVVPRDEEDVCSLVRYCAEHLLPLVPRGAGTGQAGGCLGEGLIVDFSVHFRGVRNTGSEDTIEVEAGVTLRQLQEVLARQGRRFAAGPDSLEGTVGGMLADNRSGPRAGKLGTPRDHVVGLRIVLDSGEAHTVGRVPRWPTSQQRESSATASGRLEDIVTGVGTLLEQNASLLSRGQLPGCGYALHDVLHDDTIDLPRLLTGSEGSLALIVAATLRTEPIPAGRTVLLLGFARMDAALRASRSVLAAGPTACELLDRRLLRLARSEPAVAELLPEAVEAVLLSEFEGDSLRSARWSAAALLERLLRRDRLALVGRLADDSEEADRLWQLRQSAQPGLYAVRDTAQPIGLIDDTAVPPEALSEYINGLLDILRRHEWIAPFLIRPGTGQVILRPFVDLQSPRQTDRLWSLADEVYTLALSLGGTLRAAQGTGLARMPWIGRQSGRLAGVYRDLKAIFDPRHLFNPGKIVGFPTQPVTWPLRQRGESNKSEQRDASLPLQTSERRSLRTLSLQLVWPESDPGRESLACNGCGECRSEAATLRMCPIFRASGAEAASPRAKANLMRWLLAPQTDPATLTSDAVREVADLCVNCKMCELECPSRVGIARMMLEIKAAHVAEHGLDRGDWMLARTESFAWLGSLFAPVTNAVLANRLTRWLLERLFALSSQRRLPRFAGRSFLRRAQQRGWTRKPSANRPRVAYFVDVFANYNDPLLAESVVEVLHHNGIEVYVPPGQLGCGMAPLAQGDVETAREVIGHNLRIFADLAREGFVILCAEPTAAVLLRRDALEVLDDADAQLVADQVVEFTAYLWQLHQRGELRTDFAPLATSIAHHVPCHIKALGVPPAGPDLLRLIPDLRVTTLDVSCSGMAGTYGLREGNHERSLEAGRPMLTELARPAYLFGSTECSACRLQMEDGANKRTLHPAQYLALAYGRMPQLLHRLRQPIGKALL